MDTVVVKAGDVLVYDREDGGGDFIIRHPTTGERIGGWRFTPTYAHLEGREPDPHEHIIAGDPDPNKGLPLELCQRLVEDKICRVLNTDELAQAPAAPQPLIMGEQESPLAPNNGGTGEAKGKKTSTVSSQGVAPVSN